MALIDTPENELELEREALRYTYEEPCGMYVYIFSFVGRNVVEILFVLLLCLLACLPVCFLDPPLLTPLRRI